MENLRSLIYLYSHIFCDFLIMKVYRKNKYSIYPLIEEINFVSVSVGLLSGKCDNLIQNHIGKVLFPSQPCGSYIPTAFCFAQYTTAINVSFSI